MYPGRMLEWFETVMASVEKEAAILADERPHLIVLRGPSLGDFFALEGEVLVLGSDPFRADVVVRDIVVEPRHAKIFRDPGGEYVLKDLDTGKGTIVNDEALEGERALSDGDRITLSNSVLEFSHGDPVRADFHGALHRLISRDYLTDLLVKNRFDEEFEHHLESAEGRPLSVLMADIDNLKKINDAHGHLLGEHIVGEIGRIIGELHEEGGRQATRFGGDEYQTILPGLSKEEALKIAEEIRRRVEEHTFEHDGVSPRPTLSLGVATYPEDGKARAALTRAADEALYRAKRSGGNTVSA
jgi:two-component system cell cycle response regulator